jgi:arylsulfatase A-like enzyme
MHALSSDLERIDGISGKRRRKLAAMTVALDRAVGTVLDALVASKIEKDTLVFFVNDNGGATNNASSNAPLRGHKGTPYEGGIRVPFLVKWPAKLPRGVVYGHPVSTLDILPTALAAAGGRPDSAVALDGVDLTPYLVDPEQEGRPHQRLLWRKGESWAIRDGDWKLLHCASRKPALATSSPALFDLAADPRETRDRAAAQPERVAVLLASYRAWEKQLAKPRWAYGRARRKGRK